MTLGEVYTLAEVAEHLRTTNRAVAKIARRHGLCMMNGRKMTFTEDDIQGIKQALRLAPAEPLPFWPKPAVSDYRLQQSLLALSRKKSVSPKARKIVLERSKRPSHRKMLDEEFGGAK